MASGIYPPREQPVEPTTNEGQSEASNVYRYDPISHYIDFGEMPSLRLTKREWYALCTTVGLRFAITYNQFTNLPESLKSKFQKMEC